MAYNETGIYTKMSACPVQSTGLTYQRMQAPLKWGTGDNSTESCSLASTGQGEYSLRMYQWGLKPSKPKKHSGIYIKHILTFSNLIACIG